MKITCITPFFYVFIIFQQGCTSTLKNDEAIEVWHSPSSTPTQLVKAVNVLVPKGSSPKYIEKILGDKCTWVRFHGPSGNLYVGNSVIDNKALQTNSVDFWSLQYKRAGGFVSLEFDQPSNDWNFDAFKLTSVGFDISLNVVGHWVTN